MNFADAKIIYDADGIPTVNGEVPTWRIAKKTPIRNASGTIVDYDCELAPTNEAARIMAQVNAAQRAVNQ